MKNYLLFGLFFITLFSCKKDDSAILESPDKRLNMTLADYEKHLVDTEFGWIGYLLTGTEKVHVFKMAFSDKNRVNMSSDYAKTNAESSYILRALQKPTLIFDTYSTIHIINDPSSNVSGGEIGEGQITDFEFQFIRASQDTIELEGVLNKSKFFLIKAKSKKELDDSFNIYQDIKNEYNKLQTYFRRVNVGGIDCEININDANKRFTLKYLENDELVIKDVNYFNVGNRLRFFQTIKLGDTEINGLNDFRYDDQAKAVVATTFGGKEFVIKEETKPLKYEVNVPKLWIDWTAASGYVSAYEGFHANGSDDGLGLKTLAGFRRLDFVAPTATVSNHVARIVASTNYGPIFKTTINENGIVIFTQTGTSGTVPSAATDTFNKYVAQYTQPEGYYIIRVKGGGTRDQIYDMVSVSDGKAWATWAY
ncbi:DUF4302 domain-containing protein [Sphingobacterium bovistauri]|uniref:DUF4302 domain-containing protein n=1 Tax=Sphingobacterium bovistauri TaxID=2781959 RepID=A0ABS7Z7S4_9SPHI|nr:DUF4302 domain-containing protein [Sphingobacterium bovistauri]MCA5006200.1 DUF4302 domain-containing protein [Sphingobacterium bovistauri]